MMAPPTGVALFGLGRAGMIHFRNILANYRLRLQYVVELNSTHAHQVLEQYGLENTVCLLPPDQAERVYKDPGVAAVIVATPTFDHENIVLPALQNGKGVFCEKPISQTPEGTRRCYEAAETAGKPLLCSFNRRFDPGLMRLKTKVSGGACGQVLSIRSVARDHPFPPLEYMKISGGIYHDCAVHDLDLVCWLLESYPLTVYAEGYAHRDDIREMKDVDNTTIILKFPNNTIATIDLSRLACYGYDQRCEVFGTAGMAVSENQRTTEVVTHDVTGSAADKIKHSFPQRYADSYVNALNEFLDILQGKKENPITKEHTLAISNLASACERSLHTKSVVTL